MKIFIILITFIIFYYYPCAQNEINNNSEKLPTVLIVSLIRNKAHTLPYFFSYLENLDYPKSRIALLFHSDHNEDNSIELIHIWLNRTTTKYNHIDFKYQQLPKRHQNETTPNDWTKERFSHVIKLKEEALEMGEKLWADFIFFLDADVLLTNPATLKSLISYKLPIIAPMLFSEGLYSNFWCGMSDDYYYHRTDEYKEIYELIKLGNFQVPMVHSAVLINLNYIRTKYLTFDRQRLLLNQKLLMLNENINNIKLYDGPTDDIIIFAISANSSDIPMYISNSMSYGYIIQPLEINDEIHRDYQQLLNIKLNIINDLSTEIDIANEFKKYIFYPEKHKLSLDHIYMINLERRPERRKKMEMSFKELGIDVEYFPAIDGKKLNVSKIEKMGIKFLPGYEDPYHHRQMTMGEIGCFLSHYKIWEKIIELGQQEVLILEDDIRFEPYFRERAIHILNQARKVGNWDLIYFGRKRLESEDEPWVEGTKNLVHVGYSYWTLGYVITLEGAKKLINIKPLEKLIPVDEFLPIMFNRHPNDTWNSAFNIKNLLAYSAAPLIVFPTYYTGEDGYISDTEDSEITPIRDSSGSSAELKSDKEKRIYSNQQFDDFMDDDIKTNFMQEHIIKAGITQRDPSEL